MKKNEKKCGKVTTKIRWCNMSPPRTVHRRRMHHCRRRQLIEVVDRAGEGEAGQVAA